ncbi:hypothetical protein [Bradyrhizobium sp. RT7b]|uniref:hypothetical protein n=1 Tax=unclassified Bradyrhizobium TaxID=2631580 RepID=UPI003399E6FC
MIGLTTMSPAARALGNLGGNFGGDALQQQTADQTEEMRRKRQLEAQAANYSPAGVALSGAGILG